MKMVETFPDAKLVTANALTEYCDRNGIPVEDRPDVEQLGDYIYQVDNDRRMVTLYKKVLNALQELEYIPEFEEDKKRRELAQKNDDVSIVILNLFEEAGLPFILIDKIANELGGMTGRTIESAGTRGFNKAMNVLTEIARKHFGGEVNMLHVRDYVQNLYDEAEAKTKAKHETAN